MLYLLQIQRRFDQGQVRLNVSLQCGDINWLSYAASHDDENPTGAEEINGEYGISLERSVDQNHSSFKANGVDRYCSVQSTCEPRLKSASPGFEATNRGGSRRRPRSPTGPKYPLTRTIHVDRVLCLAH